MVSAWDENIVGMVIVEEDCLWKRLFLRIDFTKLRIRAIGSNDFTPLWLPVCCGDDLFVLSDTLEACNESKYSRSEGALRP